jgi:regulator of protease activity HflC (stomatin/prohibitin superfamily)
MQAPRKRFYQETWFKIAWAPGALFLVYAGLLFLPGLTIVSIMVDILAFAMLFFGTLALASQYVLPVRTMKERRASFDRMTAYVSGGHGPIVFIREGAFVGSAEELKRKGAGVILVDGSSGVVLEKGRKFSRAEGPGIVFTEFGERMAASFDLRKQSRSQDTHALTKDGIEIKTSVSVTFALDPGDQVSPRESPEERDILGMGQARITPAFPFNPDSAFKAYYGFAINDKQEMLQWDALPVVVATEYFRDQVSRYTLDDLFRPNDPQSSPVAALQTRLTDQVQKAPLLRDRGIKVYSVSIGALELPDEVTRQRVRAWASHWQREAIATLSSAEVEVERVKERARAEAQAEMLNHFREFLAQTFTGDGEAGKKEIAQKFVAALNRVADDPVTRMLISGDTMRQIVNLRHWVNLPVEGEPEVQLIGKPASEDLSEIVAEDTPEEESDSLAYSPLTMGDDDLSDAFSDEGGLKGDAA